MMKISNETPITSVTRPEPLNSSGTVKPLGPDFQSLLRSAATSDSQKPAEIFQALDLKAISQAEFTSGHTMDKSAMIQQTSALLDLLEKYRTALSNPQCSLKHLDALLREVRAEKDRMLPLVELLSAGDGLRDVLNRLSIDIALESIKLERGDYLA